MGAVLEILKSGTFWTAFGSIATAIGVWFMFQERKWKNRGGDKPNPPPVPPDPPNVSPGRMTNREKIQACLAKHPDGATLGQIAEETGIPIGSLSSDLAGRDAMGIVKEGHGSTATYRLKVTRTGDRLTNRDKIQGCLAKHPQGATLERIAEETGIPIGSLSSDLSGRELMGIEKEGYGKTAIYRLKPQSS